MQNNFSYYFLVCLLFSLTFFSCDPQNSATLEKTYFGGEIINPNSNYIVLSKNTVVKDTIYLNEKNQFFYTFDSVRSGIYSIRHKPESQIVLFEPGDSIMMRLNTLEFDETLVFTGEGSKKNNFLADMYLQNEEERSTLRKKSFNLPPELFKIQQDSLLKQRRKRFERFVRKNDISPLAKSILQASYQYDFFSRFELYENNNSKKKKRGEEYIGQLPSSFFSYRKNIDINNENYRRLYAHRQFLEYYLNNQLNNSKAFKKITGSANQRIFEINFIDSIISNSHIKENMFRSLVGNYLIRNNDSILSHQVLQHYLDQSENTFFKNEMKQLFEANQKLSIGRKIPKIKLVNTAGDTVQLTSLLNAPHTVLYFWSTQDKPHFTRAHEKTKALSITYPMVNFIGINVDTDQQKDWLKTIKRNKFNSELEYEFSNPKQAIKELVIYFKNKVILLDKDGRIVEPNSNLFSVGLEKKLMELYPEGNTANSSF